MTKVDFYVLETDTRLETVCQLIQSFYQNKHRIYVHAHNQEEAFLLDELLWTHDESSFLPHNLYGEGPELAPPIQIGFASDPLKSNDILFNLAEKIPEFYTRFAHVIEIVSPKTQEISREHFRFYRLQQITIQTHKLLTTVE